MKNKVVRRIVGGMFALTMTVGTATPTLAAPVAGVFSEMSGAEEADNAAATKGKTAKNGKNSKKLVPTSMEKEGTANASESIEKVNTELATETESVVTDRAKLENTATAGISLIMADMMAEETEKAETVAVQAAEPAAEKESEASSEAKAVTEAASTEESKETKVTEATEATETTEAAEAAEAGEATEGTEAETEGAKDQTADAGEAVEEEPHEDAFFTEEVVNEFADKGIAVVEDFVNVRTEPNTESEIAGKLYKNNACDVLGSVQDGQWLRIKSGDLEGYVSADYISVGDSEVIKQACKRVAKVNTETLYVRALPSQDSDVMGMVPDGEELTVCDETYLYNWGWVGVSIEEGTGYVSAGYVELYTEYTYGETKAAEEERLAREEAERRAAEEAARAAAEAEARKNNQSSSSSSSSSGSSSSGGVTAPGSSTGSSVANYALQFVGNPYVYGGSSLTNGTDCSGFVMSVYAAFGVGLPHSSSALRGCGYGVDVGSMSPGDIVCYSGHVGICIGNGQIVHASTAATGIKVSTAYYRDILAVRRIF